jgi:hypothetical protein
MGFLVPGGIHVFQERIEKGFGGLLERNPIVVQRILPCLSFCPR